MYGKTGKNNDSIRQAVAIYIPVQAGRNIRENKEIEREKEVEGGKRKKKRVKIMEKRETNQYRIGK